MIIKAGFRLYHMKKITFFALVFFPLISYSQVRSEFWTKTYIENAISQHWSIGVDVVKKTQNDYYENDHNLFRKNLTTGGRLWAVYKTKNAWQFFVSPFGWFVTGNLKRSGYLSSSNEFRVSAGSSKLIKILTVNNLNRVLVEFRDINLCQPNHTYQVRYRLLNRFDLHLVPIGKKNKLDYVASNEFFYETQSGSSGIDQDQIFNGLELKHLHTSEIIAGYQYTSQNTFAGIIQHHQALIFFNVFL